MFKVFRCKKTRKVKFHMNNRFGCGACDDLIKLKKNLAYQAGDANTRSSYKDRKDLWLNRV